MKERGFAVHLERIIRVNELTVKPDLIGLKENQAVVLDAQIISKSCSCKRVHINKREKYSVAKFQTAVTDTYLKNNITTTTAVRPYERPKGARYLHQI